MLPSFRSRLGRYAAIPAMGCFYCGPRNVKSVGSFLVEALSVSDGFQWLQPLRQSKRAAWLLQAVGAVKPFYGFHAGALPWLKDYGFAWEQFSRSGVLSSMRFFKRYLKLVTLLIGKL